MRRSGSSRQRLLPLELPAPRPANHPLTIAPTPKKTKRQSALGSATIKRLVMTWKPSVLAINRSSAGRLLA